MAYKSVRATLGSKDVPRKSVKRITTVSTRGGPRRITKVAGTPTLTGPTELPKAQQEARRVKRSLRRVRRAQASGPDLSSVGLDPEQRSVLSTVLRRGERAGATKKEKLSAVQTGLVEAHLTNPPGGHGTSAGWRQEIDSYGPVSERTNVKRSADRYFQETAAAGRGKGMTSGQLSQAVQRSAFPERYDEVRPQAKALLKAASKPKIKSKPKDVKTLRKAGIEPRKTAAKKPKKKPGAWAGAQKAVLSHVPVSARAEGRGDKRTPAENDAVGGSDTSDHLTTNKKAYAADLPPDDALARKIAKKVGLPSHTGTNEVVKDGYRYQMIWQDEGHYDHIHFGAEWVGEGVPPGTRLGGPSGGGAAVSGGGTTVSTGGGTTTTTQEKKKRKKVTPRPPLGQILSGGTVPEVSLSDLEREYGLA